MIYIAYPSKSPKEIKGALNGLKESFEVTTPEDRHKIPEKEFAERSKNLLRNSVLLIAEASQPSSGVHIEATWAHENEIPIILLVENGKDYPSYLKGIYLKIIRYIGIEDLMEKIIEFLNSKFPSENKQEFFEYGDKKQYKSYKKGWQRRYK